MAGGHRGQRYGADLNLRGMSAPRACATGLLAALTVVACGGGGGGSAAPAATGGVCSIAAEKDFVRRVSSEWYLFLDLLPAALNPDAYATADDLLDAMTATARAQGRDRYFSYITTVSAEQQFFAEGQSVGFGLSIVTPAGTTQAFVTQVFESSAAADAGFLRGDEILAIGPSSAALQDIAAILAQPDGLAGALGSATAGLTRVFRVRSLPGAVAERTVTKREFALNPVPSTALIARAGLAPVGYLNLRTFISPADAPLRSAFAGFAAQNVRDLIVDLRYNGGGALATAELLGNLLLAGQTNQILYRTRLNPNKSSNEETVRVRVEPGALPAQRIAFLALGGSASASELVINTLAPYAEVAIVGARTYGKPVGQYAFDLSRSCDMRLRLVTFKIANRNDYGDYYAGLPDAAAQVPDAFCATADDLTRAQGAGEEALTHTALQWLASGVCPTPVTGQAKAAAAIDGTYPRPRKAAPFQVAIPGAF